jgi:hypothetical protein
MGAESAHRAQPIAQAFPAFTGHPPHPARQPSASAKSNGLCASRTKRSCWNDPFMHRCEPGRRLALLVPEFLHLDLVRREEPLHCELEILHAIALPLGSLDSRDVERWCTSQKARRGSADLSPRQPGEHVDPRGSDQLGLNSDDGGVYSGKRACDSGRSTGPCKIQRTQAVFHR